MHKAIVDKLYNEYIANGFISEDIVFDALQEEGIPLFDVELICDQLLARGVIILERNEVADDDVENESLDQTQTDYKAVYSEIVDLDEGLCDIVEYIKSIRPPQRREWQNLLPQAQNGNLYARNRVFEMYMRVASKIALQYAKRYELSIADTMQDAFIGLSIAIDKFEYGRQDHFTTYFPFWIRQNIMREARIKDLPFFFPVRIKDRLFVICDLIVSHNCPKCAINALCPNLISEISLALECDNKEAEYLHSLLHPPISIEDLIEKEYSENSEENKSLFNNDIHCYEEDGLFAKVESEELSHIISNCLKTLTIREERVLRLRYGLDDGKEKTLEEVGNILSVTRERVRQIESKALKKLRRPMVLLKLKSFL